MKVFVCLALLGASVLAREDPYGMFAYNNQNPYGMFAYGNEDPYGMFAYGNQNPYGMFAYGNQNPYGMFAYGAQKPKEVGDTLVKLNDPDAPVLVRENAKGKQLKVLPNNNYVQGLLRQLQQTRPLASHRVISSINK